MDKENQVNDLLISIKDEITELMEHTDESSWEDHFAEIMIEYLTEAGELDDGEICEYKRKGLKINGYSYGSDIDSVDIFTVFCSRKIPSISISKNQVDSEFEKAAVFLKKCLFEGYFNLISEASPELDLALLLHERQKFLRQARIILFTDCRTKPLIIPKININDVEVTFHIWDIQRLNKLLYSGNKRETIEIDFQKEFEDPISCLEISNGNPDYKTVLAVFPGTVLASIYGRFGARLLERNVRTFLQARGKVNKGIRATLNIKPEMFLAYNNGITGTAEQIELEESDHRIIIKSVKNFQIVNGGQTTASLYHTLKNDKVDLSKVYVQAKICIISDKKNVDEVVPLISRYSNSQNKVSEADFYANDPFHIEVEELSRTTWAPAMEGSNKQTRWFYERARGQYNDEQSKLTLAQKKNFRIENPSFQKFTKTDLSKFENTWNQRPWIVSLGAQKNFRDFNARLSERKGFMADQEYFQKLISKAIMFRTTEKIVSSQEYGGYRANIVTYSLAWLSFLSYQRIDLDKVWKLQSLTESLSEAIRKLSKVVYDHITNPPGGRNITEWCKKEECWNNLKLLEVPFNMSDIRLDQLESSGKVLRVPEKGIEGPDQKDQKIIDEIMEIPAEKWFAIANWAKETDNLQSWQRSISFSIGKLINRGKIPSRKQAIQGAAILKEAKRFGFPI